MSTDTAPQSPDTILPENAIIYLSTMAPHETSGAWKMSRDAATRIRERVQATPPGGWRALGALSCGPSAYLNAKRDAFLAGASPRDLDLEPTLVRKTLVEQFTRYLVPPTTSAGLFIMLGIHPAWGVHIAHTLRRDDPGDGKPMFSAQTRDCVMFGIREALSDIVQSLRSLEPGVSYNIADLSDVVGRVMEDVRDLQQEIPYDSTGLDPYVDAADATSGSWRASDFTRSDLLDAWLIPAGIARRENGQFEITPKGRNALKAIQILPD
jgi:hypothetical protein